MLLAGLWKIGNWKCAAQHQHAWHDTATYGVHVKHSQIENAMSVDTRHTHTRSTTYVSGSLLISTNVDKRPMWISAMNERKHPLDFCNRSFLHQMYSFLLANWRGFENLMRFSISTIRMVDLTENGKNVSMFVVDGTVHHENIIFCEATLLQLNQKTNYRRKLENENPWNIVNLAFLKLARLLSKKKALAGFIWFCRKKLLDSKFCTKSEKAESGEINVCKKGFRPEANTFVSSAINSIYGHCSSTNLPTCTCTCIGTNGWGARVTHLDVLQFSPRHHSALRSAASVRNHVVYQLVHP